MEFRWEKKEKEILSLEFYFETDFLACCGGNDHLCMSLLLFLRPASSFTSSSAPASTPTSSYSSASSTHSSSFSYYLTSSSRPSPPQAPPPIQPPFAPRPPAPRPALPRARIQFSDHSIVQLVFCIQSVAIRELRNALAAAIACASQLIHIEASVYRETMYTYIYVNGILINETRPVVEAPCGDQ